MIAEQPELELLTAAPAGTDRHPRHDDLRAALASGKWVSRRDLGALGFGDRELRKIVELDRGRTFFSYPGSPGYKLLQFVELKEIRRVYALRNQAKGMEARCVAILAAWHRLGREVPMP